MHTLPADRAPLHHVSFQIEQIRLFMLGQKEGLFPPVNDPNAALNYLLHKFNGAFFDYHLRPYHYESKLFEGSLQMSGYVEEPYLGHVQNHDFIKDFKNTPVPRLQPGALVRFKIRAEATEDAPVTSASCNSKRKSRRRNTVELHPDLTEGEALRQWLQQRMQKAVSITSLSVLSFGPQTMGHWNQPREKRRNNGDFQCSQTPVAEFEGEGQITDADAWELRLRRGIGKHQAFGLSMIRPC